jgi:hypothetical protein
MNEDKKHFGRELFEKVMHCKTYPYNRQRVGPLSMLTDHGFVADRACLWSAELEGHEYAVVARTYCSAVEIDHPPLGIKCVRLPLLVMGEDEPGVPIALVVTGKSLRSQELLTGYLDLPASVIAHAIQNEMSADGWAVCLPVTGGVLPYPKILQVGRPW